MMRCAIADSKYEQGQCSHPGQKTVSSWRPRPTGSANRSHDWSRVISVQVRFLHAHGSSHMANPRRCCAGSGSGALSLVAGTMQHACQEPHAPTPSKFHVAMLSCLCRRIGRLHAGQQFGEMSCWTGRRREHSVVTITQAELYCLARDALLDLVQKWPELGADFSSRFSFN